VLRSKVIAKMSLGLNNKDHTLDATRFGVGDTHCGERYFKVEEGEEGTVKIRQSVLESLDAAQDMSGAGVVLSFADGDDRQYARELLLERLNGKYRSIQTSDDWWQVELANGSVVRIAIDFQIVEHNGQLIRGEE
jgi:hypothetical protein